MNAAPTNHYATGHRATRTTTICVVGAGYVGLTAAACLARLGHRVRCVESDPTRLAILQRGGVPIHEPGLAPLISLGCSQGHLSFGSDITTGITGATIVLLCVGTPPQPSGEPDLRQLGGAATAVAAAAGPGELTIVVKSTVPPGSCEAIELLARDAAGDGVSLEVVSNPEFLRESQAVHDFFHPDRIVIGAATERAAAGVAALYPSSWPILHCDRRSAELVKYASNTFLAVKISFANEIAGLCEGLGADARQVLLGVGLDNRIGSSFLDPGPGFGGSCLSKDLSGLIATAAAANCPTPVAVAAGAGNTQARARIVDTLRVTLGGLAGRRIAALGLAFKAGTDDVRDSPATAIIRQLRQDGAMVTTYDPVAGFDEADVDRRNDPYEAAAGADALVVLCGWPEFAHLDPYRIESAMRGALIVDTVGVVDVPAFEAVEFEILSVGRRLSSPPSPVVLRPLEWALDTTLV